MNKMCRRRMEVSKGQMLEASDVSIGENKALKIYCGLNFLFWLGQMFTLFLFSTSLLGTGSVLNQKDDNL